jgi:integrase
MIKVHVRFKQGRNLQLYYVSPDTGREVSKSAGTRDLREADRAAMKWEEELTSFRGRDNDGWQHFRSRFEDEHLTPLARKSRDCYINALDHLERIVGPITVRDITPSALSVFQSRLLAEKRPLTSISNYLTHIRKALNWAAEIEMIEKAPKVRMPRQINRQFMRGRPLTEVEFKAMVKACPVACGLAAARQWQRFLELLWLSGMRLGEAFAFSWDKPPIVLDLTGGRYPQILYYAEGQKARRDDAIPITPDLAAWLKKTPAKHRHGPVAQLPLETVPRVSERIVDIGKAAGVIVSDKGKAGSAHDFRRAFGTRWAQQVMPMTLQKLMRHANITTTLKYYIGLSCEDAGRELWGVPKSVPKKASKRRKAG